ncbi:MAG: protein-glutamate O-methyltransferase CheR [Bryobacterales bacterium]|nr:protein-glutamate O-methyltransferase CheR [Bryobacterales bacterium]
MTDTRPQMTSYDLELWQAAVNERWGLHYSEGRVHQLSSVLWRRMQKLGMDSFRAYHRFAGSSPGEWNLLLESVLNHESSFFRHLPSFDALWEVVFPDLAMRKAQRREDTIRIWSAACSIGQEPYSLAMAALDHPSLHMLRITVRGSDISRAVLEAARRGAYTQRAMDGVPEIQRRRHFIPNPGGGFQAGRGLRQTCEFTEFNLCNPATYGPGEYDVIFCQNALIYFCAEQRIRTMQSLASRLAPGGYLFLAPGEAFGVRLDGCRDARLRECLSFQKTEKI